MCDADVNECAIFAGTDLGCQNGATCVNKPGGYEWVYSQFQPIICFNNKKSKTGVFVQLVGLASTVCDVPMIVTQDLQPNYVGMELA